MQRTEKALRGVLAAAMVFLVLATGLACGADKPASYDEWAPLRVSGDEAEPYRPLAEMGQSADVVAIGRFTDILEVRTVGAAGNSPAYLLPVLFSPSRMLKGDADASLVVEFTLGAVRSEQVDTDAFRKALVGPELLLLLRAKRGDGEQGLYRVVNSYGLWVTTDRHVLDAPLAEGDPWVREEFSATLSGAGDSLSALAEATVS